MRFVHAADTHIGCAYRGLSEREEDFRDVFTEIIDRTLELAPDAFVHAGDLFERSRPSNKDIIFAATELMRLMRAGIEVILLPGNHDFRIVRGEVSPQRILELLGARVFGLGEDKKRYEVKGVEFWGIPYMSQKTLLLRFLSEIGEKARGPAVLVLHQYFYPPASFSPFLYPQDIPPVFSYAALGHFHIPYYRKEYRYAYPGSSEARELSAQDAMVKKRLFYLVEADDSGIKLEPHFLRKTRPFFYLECQEDELAEKLKDIAEETGGAEKKPMLKVKVRGGPEMRADRVVDNALRASGLKREDFLILDVSAERTEGLAPEIQSGEERAQEDMLERFFGNQPRLLGLVTTMREAVMRTEAEREFSWTQARRDRQILIEAAKSAALQYMEESNDEVDQAKA